MTTCDLVSASFARARARELASVICSMRAARPPLPAERAARASPSRVQLELAGEPLQRVESAGRLCLKRRRRATRGHKLTTNETLEEAADECVCLLAHSLACLLASGHNDDTQNNDERARGAERAGAIISERAQAKNELRERARNSPRGAHRSARWQSYSSK